VLTDAVTQMDDAREDSTHGLPGSPTVAEVTVEYEIHGVPLEQYQLTRADHRRQQESERCHEWVVKQVAKAPPISEANWARLRKLLGPPCPPWKLMRWRVRLYCGHIVEVTRLRQCARADGGVTDKERCPTCGADPSIIVAFEPLGSLAEPPVEAAANVRSGKPLGAPVARRRTKVELEAENAALRAEVEALRGRPGGST
jgi:hypothetical protein